MLELVQLLAGSNPLMLAFAVLIFDFPRYTLSLLSLAIFGAWRASAAAPAGHASVSVILPTFNGGDGLMRSVVSLRRQTLQPREIIVVDDRRIRQYRFGGGPQEPRDRIPQCLSETGFVEGKDVTIEYHWLDGRTDQLAAVMADLVKRKVAVIATPGSVVAALAAKAATTTVPIAFAVPDDPVRLGLVANLGRPGGNATGINTFSQEVTGKRLRLLNDLVPKATRFALLVNPGNASSTQSTLRELRKAAGDMGVQIQKILNASTASEIDAAFDLLARERVDALFVASDAFFNSRGVQFAT